MTDYKDTLNLPRTAFPMKANLANREPKTLQHWQQLGIYQLLRKQRAGCKKFILHDGPPYANGDIHIGHAVNKILKDIIIKAKSLAGFDCPYVPGWDCHGLPIELNVEKKWGKAGAKLTAAQFRSRCREYAQSQVDRQRLDFIRLGVIGDWEHPYLTMDYHFEANIIRTLAKIIANGHLVKGYKPIHWCSHCQSALAEAELEYQDKVSPSIYVRFAVLDSDKVSQVFTPVDNDLGSGPLEMVIWTTTPWTLPANQAIAVHAELTYLLVEHAANDHKERIIVAEDLLASVLSAGEISDYRVVGSCLGKVLEKFSAQHPFYDRTSLIVIGDHVTTEMGTGCVHTAPGHGVDDYNVGQHYGLPVDHPVDDRGCFAADTLYVGGLHVFKSNDTIIELLRTNGRLLACADLNHSYPHCWRHKKPIIFRATPQWFISMDNKQFRQQILAAIDNVSWVPDWGQARIRGMIENSPDWCISRQRSWSVPIPVFVHKQTGELYPQTPDIIERIAQEVEQHGIEAWYQMSPASILGDDYHDYEKVTDGLDVWFDSGATHACVLEQHPDLQYPADLYLEGSDQHRGWFQSSLKVAMATKGEPPYRQAVTHGFTVDANGHKMSKSLGNVISPQKLFNTLGADVLRLWVASSDFSAEMSVSDEILTRIADAYRRVRNTARFLLSNLHGFSPDESLVPGDKLLALDAWVVTQADKLQQKIKQAYDDYHFHHIYQSINKFCTSDLGGFYLDIIKDRQYTTQENSLARRSAQTAMYYLTHYLVRWLMPITSFTAEEIWQHLPAANDEQSVLLTTWFKAPIDTMSNSAATINWQAIINTRDEINKLLEQKRVTGEIGSSLAADVIIYADEQLYATLSAIGDELRFVLITSSAEIVPAMQRPNDAVAIDGGWVQLNASPHEKCERCWHRRAEVGNSDEHPGLCARCLDNVQGTGEVRCYA